MAIVKFFIHNNEVTADSENLFPKEKEIIVRINKLLRNRKDIFDKYQGVFKLQINSDRIFIADYSTDTHHSDITIPSELFDVVSRSVFLSLITKIYFPL